MACAVCEPWSHLCRLQAHHQSHCGVSDAHLDTSQGVDCARIRVNYYGNQLDSQRIGHRCGCGISTCDEYIDNLVSDELYISVVLLIEVIDEGISVR